jgi:signal transduction histidine kinase
MNFLQGGGGMKLLLTVLFLIVLPTAWLSLLAGRSIQARELLLEQRLTDEAQQALEQIGEQSRSLLSDALTLLVSHVRSTVLAGADVRQFGTSISFEKGEYPFLHRVFLYLRPWGFIYPEEASPTFSIPNDRFVLLSHRLASLLGSDPFSPSISVDNGLYIFQRASEDPHLYVGFELNQEAFITRLEEIVRAHSTAHIEYRILQVGPLQHTETSVGQPAIEVQDNLSVLPESIVEDMQFIPQARQRDVLVSGVLGKPLGHIVIGAIAVNARDMSSARALQNQLFWWGVILLAFVMLSSTVILITYSRRQAHHARIRSVFIAGLSHDIRTPVTAMKALAEGLQQGRVTGEDRKQEFLDSIVSECDRLQTLIERVLLFFRQEQRGVESPKSTIELIPLCEYVCATFRSRHKGRVELACTFPADAQLLMWGDAAAIEQALHNLLENAWKYGRPRPCHPDQVVWIGVRLELVPGSIFHRCIQIRVEDKGPGIPFGEQRKVFDRFYRTSDPQHHASGGIGLGLALVSEIVRSHQGRIDVGRSVHGGAMFTMRFRPFPFAFWSGKSFVLAYFRTIFGRKQ